MSPSPPQSKRTSHIFTVITLVVSVACLAWAVHGVSWTELWEEIRELDWRWVAVGAIADLLVYVVQGWRWSLLLLPVARCLLGFGGRHLRRPVRQRSAAAARRRTDPLFFDGPLEQDSHLGDAGLGVDRANFRRRVAHRRAVSLAALHPPFSAQPGPGSGHRDHHHRQHFPGDPPLHLRRAAGRRDVLARAGSGCSAGRAHCFPGRTCSSRICIASAIRAFSISPRRSAFLTC